MAASAQRMYLFEFLISKIKIEPAVMPVPKLEDISIYFQCPDILFVNISPTELSVESMNLKLQPADGFFQLDFGKTYLFTSTAEALVKILQEHPLEIDLKIYGQTVGTSLFIWKKEFIDQISIFETIGIVKGVNYDGSFELVNSQSKKVGQIDLVIKMSCLGDTVETYFCFQKSGAIFMHSRSDAKFKCERYNITNDVVIPVANFFNPLLTTRMSTPKLSWTELFGNRAAENKQSIAPMLIEGDDSARSPTVNRRPIDTVSYGSQYDIVSMVYRPPENKFFDFLNMMRAEVTAKEEETIVTLAIDKPRRPITAFSEDVTVHNRESTTVKDISDLTADKINNLLCKRKDCPGAIKFKEYGIGPLATGSGLGTLYTIVEPPMTYGLSHTYGHFEHYGPYGCFRRPKDPSQPYYPPAEHFHLPDENEKPLPITRCSCQRLRGGCIKKTCSKDKFTTHTKCCKHKVPFPKKDEPRALRLRGGGINKFEAQLIAIETYQNLVKDCDELLCKISECHNKKSVRLRGGGSLDPDMMSKCISPKSAVTECKSIMDQFDQIVNAYKRALGPCGEATCPYAQNIIEQQCKDFCRDDKTSQPTQEVSCESIPCKKDICPYTEKSFLAGCGSAKCAYAKYKTGLVDDDAAMELMFLPAPVAESCGHPKCKYPPYNLPPIHWDCPEPLPKDGCKNPNCPFQPPELKALKCPPPIPQQRGPCGNINCPFALPPPCNNPNCPFKQTPCPYLERKKKGDPNSTCDESVSDDGICDNPNCPFRKESEASDICDNPDCPFKKQAKNDADYCGNPNCPSAPKYPQVQKTKKKKKQNNGCDNPDCPNNVDQSEPEYCGNPDCPSAPKSKKKKTKKDNFCGSPNCPFKPDKSSSSGSSICSNPNCPLAQKKKKNNVCDNPNCPFAQNSQQDQGEDSVCSNPECPFAQKKKTCTCGNPDCPRAPKVEDLDSVCGSPECPYSADESAQKKSSVCSNPECPFAKKKKGKGCGNGKKTQKKDSVCSNPDCPFAQKKSSNICGNADCPYGQLSEDKDSICSNPDCFFAKKKESICSNPDCPVAKKTKKSKNKISLCDNPDCPLAQIMNMCDNPDCPFGSSSESDSICDNPDCPFKKKKSVSSICSNPDCPANKQKKVSCDNGDEKSKEDSFCTNPNCPFFRRGGGNNAGNNGGGGDACANPHCPFSKNYQMDGFCGDPLCPRGDGAANFMDSKTVTLIKGPNGSKTGAGGDEIKKKKKKGRFVYSIGDKYPGVKIGHKECVTPRCKVPAYMGWLWNKYTPILQMKPRRGWRPGAIEKTIAQRIQAHRNAKGLGRLTLPKFPIRGGKGRSRDSSTASVNVKPKPTLHIQKKEGTYFITMNPLKDPKTLAVNEDPYMDCTPMQFKITKPKKIDDSLLCHCDDEPVSTSDSELDIEFTPPAGIIHPERFKKKRNIANTDTQYDPKDFQKKKAKKGGKGGKGKKGKGDKGGKGKKGKK